MSDLIDGSESGPQPRPGPGANLPEYSVAEISGAIKRALEAEFGRVRVRGEVGRVFRARSGHLYFDIKDDRNVLACTTWKGQIAGLSVAPEEGLEVVVTGRLTAYGGQSKYNMNVDDVAVAGQGALMALLEKRKTALAAEGLFDAARKQALPYLPGVVGVITSPSGAVIRDILHRLRERFARQVLIWPVAVQGKQCAPDVARAIAGFNRLTPGGTLPRPDLLIVARGGGSVEDLWGFNEEIVARATAASEIPLISAVGHETDTTLIDLVSDRRAPTPSAAAELAVPVRLDLIAQVGGQGARLTRAASQGLDHRRQRLRDLSRALPRPDSLLEGPRQRLDQTAANLRAALSRGVQVRRVALSKTSGGIRPVGLARIVGAKRDRFDDLARRLQPRLIGRETARGRDQVAALQQRLTAAFGARSAGLRQRTDAAARLLASLGYQATLERGYAVVRAAGHVVTSSRRAGRAAVLEIQFADGRITTGGAPARKSPKSPGPKSPGPKGQGSLF